MEEQDSEYDLKIQEFMKQSMVEYTADSSKLHEYLKQNLVDFPTGDGELKMFQFRTGTSNPTFLLRKNGKEFVLRHKAPVEVYIGYHKVDVEYKIMSALEKTSLPVPKMYLFCEDQTIMGQEFYVMEYIKLDMLYEGYKRTEMKKNPKAHLLMEWLKKNIPKDGKKAVIHHNDFRVSNMLYHPEKSEVLAVIDWEAASWGHPFEDLAYFCFPYHFPEEIDVIPGFKIGYRSGGIPSEDAMLSLYCELTGKSLPLPNWSFFLALVFFRVLTNIQNGIAQLRSGAQEFPISIDDLVGMLEPVVEHACKIAGLK